MSDLKFIIETIKSKGYRLTKAREGIIRIFLKSKTPLSATDLNLKLEKATIRVNRTTVYREIDFLKNQKIIRELPFSDGKKRYEKWPDNHHHHLICISCDSIECVELKGCLKDEEKKILKKNNFKTLNHSLEFQGLCEKCQ
jgi:Fe2+ or Zn2+ uptake regulation protein